MSASNRKYKKSEVANDLMLKMLWNDLLRRCIIAATKPDILKFSVFINKYFNYGASNTIKLIALFL